MLIYKHLVEEFVNLVNRQNLLIDRKADRPKC